VAPNARPSCYTHGPDYLYAAKVWPLSIVVQGPFLCRPPPCERTWSGLLAGACSTTQRVTDPRAPPPPDGADDEANDENENPEWSSAKKRARRAARQGAQDGTPGLWLADVEALIALPAATAPHKPAGAFCARAAANPWWSRPEAAVGVCSAPCVYDITPCADPMLAHVLTQVRLSPPRLPSLPFGVPPRRVYV
jgi:hypothetical protein